jgi:hypothetical protein
LGAYSGPWFGRKIRGPDKPADQEAEMNFTKIRTAAALLAALTVTAAAAPVVPDALAQTSSQHGICPCCIRMC